MQVCWGKLELNSAGHRPSRIKFDDPWPRGMQVLKHAAAQNFNIFFKYVMNILNPILSWKVCLAEIE